MKLRVATMEDFEGMHRVRLAVHENRLTRSVITADDYARAITIDGRGWVIEADGTIRAFAVAKHSDASVWALFVEPGFEGRGFGRALHECVLCWLREQGCTRAWLGTAPGTRAERFYRAAGWRCTAKVADDELRFEREL